MEMVQIGRHGFMNKSGSVFKSIDTFFMSYIT